jgi:arylsulfatase A-like enzyme
MPTILDILGVKTESNLSGLSLLGYVDEGQKIDFPEYSISEHNTRRISFVAIRTEKYKYIDYPDKKDELYDLSVDPKEQNDILNTRRVEVEELRKMALSVALERKEKQVEKVILDKKTSEELKALGYME